MSPMEAASYLLAMVYLINWLGLGLIAAKQAGADPMTPWRGLAGVARLHGAALAGLYLWPLLRAGDVEPWTNDPLRRALDSLSDDVAGHFLVAVGAAIAVMAQIQLGPRWIGLAPPEGEARLVREGLYSLSRNPGFLGQALLAIGLFLVFPGIGPAALVLLLLASLGAIAAGEEYALRQRVSDEWSVYALRVRRWFGRRGGRDRLR